MLLLCVRTPNMTFYVTQDIIDTASPDSKGYCLGAMAIRRGLASKGVRSINVTPDTVKFNMMVDVDGEMKMVRFQYNAPAPLKREAHLFDYNADKHGTAFARAHVKPFRFTLQSRTGVARAPVVQPIGDARKKRQRAASTHIVVRDDCDRRFHPETAYKTRAPKKKAA